MKARVCGVKWVKAINWNPSLIHIVDADHIPTDYVRATEIVEIELPELTAEQVMANYEHFVDQTRAAKLAALQAEINILKGE